MSDTPLTDKQVTTWIGDGIGYLPKDFAKRLERDLTTARSRIAELESKLRAATTWDGSERRCEHKMRWIKDWYGDPSIPNGTQDCSRLECTECNWVDPNGERPERDWDYERDKRMDDARDFKEDWK